MSAYIIIITLHPPPIRIICPPPPPLPPLPSFLLQRSSPLLSVHADLVLSVLSEVLHPGRRLVAGAVDNLEVPDLETRDGEEGDFEVDVDWLFLVEIALGRLNGG